MQQGVNKSLWMLLLATYTPDITPVSPMVFTLESACSQPTVRRSLVGNIKANLVNLAPVFFFNSSNLTYERLSIIDY